jgi:hypothetical protein
LALTHDIPLTARCFAPVSFTQALLNDGKAAILARSLARYFAIRLSVRANGCTAPRRFPEGCGLQESPLSSGPRFARVRPHSVEITLFYFAARDSFGRTGPTGERESARATITAAPAWGSWRSRGRILTIADFVNLLNVRLVNSCIAHASHSVFTSNRTSAVLAACDVNVPGNGLVRAPRASPTVRTTEEFSSWRAGGLRFRFRLVACPHALAKLALTRGAFRFRS